MSGIDFQVYFADKEFIMNKRINFEDNIFILIIRIRMIRDTIILDADPELFLEKTLDDICFVDQTLRILLKYLEENHLLIEREELLEHFSKTELQFFRALEELLERNGNISISEIPPISEKLIAFRNSSLERRNTAENLSLADSSLSASPIVSSDELAELLKAF